MNSMPPGDTGIDETDILFECGACGKSLVIEERGAGMLVKCTDCGETVRVPEREPRGAAELDDGVEPSSAPSVAAGNGAALESALIAARRRITHLEEELENLLVRRKELESMRARNLHLHTRIWEEVVQIGDAAGRIEDMLGMSDQPHPEPRE